jgi:hypothetical protein
MIKMAEWLTHYISPKVAAGQHPHKGGNGVFAIEPISTGELILVWGGDIVTGEQLAQIPPNIRIYAVQVEENLYQVPVPSRKPEAGDFINHSCNPTAGFRGQIALVALHDIHSGEEICIDYAMCDGSPYDEFECACGAYNCRGQVTGDDWRSSALQVRYAGYFSPYLQRRIDQMQAEKWRQVSRQNGRLVHSTHLPTA